MRANELGSSNLVFERTNAMKCVPHYLRPFLVSGPNSKKRKNCERLISFPLLALREYIAYVSRIAKIVTGAVKP